MSERVPTRFVIALSFLRSGLGLQSTPANLVLISLSLFMTFYVMALTFDKAWETGLKPLTENAITEEEVFQRITDSTGRDMPRSRQLLARASGHQWLTRMLTNLQAAFAAAGRERDMLAMQELQGLLDVSIAPSKRRVQ